MLDLLYLALVLLLIAGGTIAAMIHAQHLRKLSRGSHRRVFLPPPDVARQLIEHHRRTKDAEAEPQQRTQLPPLDVPASEQRLCLTCGTSNLREAATCRRCGAALGPVAAKKPQGSVQPTSPQHVPRGPVYGVLLTTILVSILAILYQAWRLGYRL